MKLPRIMLTAPSSGSGKTLITCGILKALKNKGLNPASFKCGPDYIDPMFHGKIIGVSSKNLDTFFTDEDTTRYLFAKEAKNADFSVMEGAMGYYDGLAGISTKASAFDVASVTKTPVVLIVNARGMSLSLGAMIKGFLEFEPESRIRGVIFNNMSSTLFPRVKEQIESKLPIKVLGYVPTVRDCVIESRHLGLVTPDDVENLQEKLNKLANILEDTIDFDQLIAIGREAPGLALEEPNQLSGIKPLKDRVRIGIARDEAFCFFYRDNLELLEKLGAELVYFSPVWDRHLPENLRGLIFYGGYPELYAEELSNNSEMISEIQSLIEGGVPYLAECGGFMYLHESMQDMEGKSYKMVGVIKGEAYKTSSLGGRFGYIELKSKDKQIFGTADMEFRGHEFHYFDSTSCGDDFTASKPLTARGWDCIHADEKSAAGFPHFHYYSNPQMIANFLEKCASFNMNGE